MCRALVQSFVQTLRTLRPVVSEKKIYIKHATQVGLTDIQEHNLNNHGRGPSDNTRHQVLEL